ncbi:MAG: phosphoglucosamine mutase [Chlamydiota bacterium]|nr:phosphoglucosamine mutase [Chlamydiota bacterium]
MEKLFGTDGVRGVANTYPMTVEVALQLGRAAAYVIRKEQDGHKIVIGKDTRLSGYMIESALAAGICSMGVDVLELGPLPTPGVAFITRSLRADAGIVISASHNPFADNGIKFFSGDGLKLPERVENEMEALIQNGQIESIRPTATDVGRAFRIEDALGRYVEFVKNSFPKGMTLDGLRIVLDCAHGAAYKAAPCVFTELGADVFIYNNKPNGTNINNQCGALYPKELQKKVIEHQAHIGIALDGDADRLICIDEKGCVIDGDYIMGICAKDLFVNDATCNKILVSTVMSNFGLDVFIRSLGGKMLRTDVGDRYVIEEMYRQNALLGGEQSGHIIFRDYTTTGDGLISALQVLRIIQQQGKSLSELCLDIQRYPQALQNIPVRIKKPFNEIKSIQTCIDEIQSVLGCDGRVFVRYSGTEPIARVLVEGPDQDKVDDYAHKISHEIKAQLGT